MKLDIRIFKIIVLIIGAILVIPIGFLLFTAITDFRPAGYLVNDRSSSLSEPVPDTLLLMTWNIGYAGLNSTSDFFFDGGKMMNPPEKTLLKSLNKIRKQISDADSLHFILLQEVDSFAKRSYYINEALFLNDLLDYPQSSFTKNYDVRYVPIPMHNPMGRVVSGLLTLGKTRPYHIARHALSGEFPYPKQWFMLDRCFSVMRYKTAHHGDLILINTHNTAFDEGGIRLQQATQLKAFMQKEYQMGNYVIAGGDFNLNPPGFVIPEKNPWNMQSNGPPLGNDFFGIGWTDAFDPQTPTNRSVENIYHKGKTITSIIDFFVCSPNIEVIQIQTISLEFGNSDHQPSTIKIRLK
ncbi:MAG: hypothetical protein Q7J34_03835 [Bacteroidales bacterium]|jgi:endonuclease/exonuclease/phosphatase family metal-dependent hydrolase|nr:hypothetical protein [Bacteroidales bacterium]